MHSLSAESGYPGFIFTHYEVKVCHLLGNNINTNKERERVRVRERVTFLRLCYYAFSYLLVALGSPIFCRIGQHYYCKINALFYINSLT